MPGEEETWGSSASVTCRYKSPEMNWTKDQGLSSRFKMWKEEVKWILKVAFKDKNKECKAKNHRVMGRPQREKPHSSVLFTERGSNGKDCKFKKTPKDSWICFTFTINPLVNYYIARDEFFRCNQGNQPVEEYLTKLQRLTDLMDYPDDGITVYQLLFDKMVTGLSDAHLIQKLYKEGKGLIIEKALHHQDICS